MQNSTFETGLRWIKHWSLGITIRRSLVVVWSLLFSGILCLLKPIQMPRQAKHFQVLLLIEILPVFPLVEKSWIWDKERLIRELWILKMFLCQKRYPCMLCALTILLILKCSFLVHHDIVDTIDTIRICTEKRPCRFIVKSLNQKIVTGGDKLGHPFYNWLTMHPNEFKKGA